MTKSSGGHRGPRAFIVVGLAWGDEGKGATVDYLTRRFEAHTVVRFNGGSQAAHTVVLDDGRHHTFAQFGSGTLAGARTHLSRFMMVDPLSMDVEAARLQAGFGINPYKMLTTDEMAVVITPYHVITNRILETARGDGRHGSCGMGIGETRADLEAGVCLRVRDLGNSDRTRAILREIRQRAIAKVEGVSSSWHYPSLKGDSMLETFAYELCNTFGRLGVIPSDHLGEILRSGTVVFEGAQGILLDEEKGISPPHVTWSKTTSQWAHELLDEQDYAGQRQTVGVMRTYMTRHGRGPFPTENPALPVSSDLHNATNEWQEGFRVGDLDRSLIEYSLGADRIDWIALTHMDQVAIEDRAFGGVPVRSWSYGPTAADRHIGVLA